ncbi:MAG: hypothetical protein WB621_23150 [Candidatus Acidiferrales bacterium]
MASTMKTWQKWLPVLIPAGFLLKDSLATIVVLSNEPGVTAANVFHYSLGLLPGSLFVSNGRAMLANAGIGFVLGWIFYGWFSRQQAA